jgi:hypothetical protein
MAIIDMRTVEPERVVKSEIDVLPTGQRPLPPPIGGTPRWAERLSGGWAAVLTAAWVSIFTIGVALEPAAADDGALPFLGVLFGAALMASWVMMAAGFAQRRRYGAVGSLMGAGLLVAMAIACPVSGHHAGIGAWWWFQAAGSVALVAASGAALRSS